MRLSGCLITYSLSIYSTLVSSSILPDIFENVKEAHSGDIEFDIDIRPITLGRVNFLHTTDIHGWFGSHANQEDFDADFGDFVSFIDIFKQNRISKDKDLIIIDTGDKLHGTGLSDASNPIGKYSQQIFNSVDYDLLTIGNHELYTPEIIKREFEGTARLPKFKDKYICSNVKYIDENGERHTMGMTHSYFVTPNTKLRVLALSFISPFKEQAKRNPNCIVTPAKEVLSDKNGWFYNDILPNYNDLNIDLILVLGHMQIRKSKPTDPDELNELHSILRGFFPNTVIQYFGGHSHIRDFVKLDSHSTALQSGRFAETLGFLSIDNFTKTDGKFSKPIFSRKYLDFNKRSFKFHAHTKSLITRKGVALSNFIQKINNKLNLSNIYGYVQDTYYFTARPYGSKYNIYTWLVKNILPTLISFPDIESLPRLIMLNTGAIRYDLVKGNFSRNSEFILSPFPNDWAYIKIPYKVAKQIESLLNNEASVFSSYQDLSPPGNTHFSRIDFNENMDKEAFIYQIISKSYLRKNFQNDKYFTVFNKNVCPIIDSPNFTLGPSTSDDGDCEGDDTPHNTMFEFTMPNVVQYVDTGIHDNSLVNFVFNDFMKQTVLQAINHICEMLQIDDDYNESDFSIYSDERVTALIRKYVKQYHPV